MTRPKRSARSVLEIATGKAPTRAKPRHLEAIEQRLFVKRWRFDPRTKYLPACAIPNGGKRGAREAALMKAEGVSAGAPDWLCFAHGRAAKEQGFRPDLMCVGLALEFKAPDGRGRLSEAQVGWHLMLRDTGWRVAIVTSAAEAWAVVADYLGLKA